MFGASRSQCVSLSVGLVLCLELVVCLPTRQGAKAHVQTSSSTFSQGYDIEQKQVQSMFTDSHHKQQRRWSQHHAPGILPQPVPEEESKPFVLDLKNFPDLANPDTDSQNPHIQVTIEVVDNPQMEVEMDLIKERNSDWPSSSSSPSSKAHWLGEKEEEWSAWSSCNGTCGHGNQTRTRSCGDHCISSESRSCDLDQCPNDLQNGTEHDMEDGTEPSDTDFDSCEKWLKCETEFLQNFLKQVLTQLPSCPCSYPPAASHTTVTLQDDDLERTFQWRDASDPKEHLDIYKPSARRCLRSALSKNGTTLAAQHCCYDNQGQLITRGKSAGTPNIISIEFSAELHFKVDVLPWILCKGNWSRLNAVRPPNNGLGCPENPLQDIFMNELEEATEY
ncbi:isthmin-2 isoform X4 [Hoplias malabaricus]|uniref:isthmin-2 isoform X4 n=1 Tax=Hoplias malabaricus TaxID=27720 RepID=UPI0034632753